MRKYMREAIDCTAMQECSRMAAQKKAEQGIAVQSLVRLAPEEQCSLAAALLEEETEVLSSFLENMSEEYAQKVESR